MTRLHCNPSASFIPVIPVLLYIVIQVALFLSSQCSDTGIQSFHNHQKHCILT
ncbi:MAG: hypothetical protein ACR5K9_05780 [Wolbachia sp.]